MKQSKNDTNLVVIDGRKPAQCKFCGQVEELRPYGPKGEAICFECAMKDEAAAKRQFGKLLNSASVVVIR